MLRYVMLSITVLLLIPASASAVTTVVTQPANGSHLVVDLSSRPTVHFAGTADVASVDLYCVSSQAGGGFNKVSIAGNVAVDMSGNFATDATWPSDGVCEVFAVNHGAVVTSNTDLNGLSGSNVYAAYTQTSIASGKAYDYNVTADASGAEDDLESVGDCTLDYGKLVQLHEYDATVFDCNGYLQGSDPTSLTAAPSMVIDAHPSYPTNYIGIDSALSTRPGWTPLTYSVTDDAGSWHLVSHEGTFRCTSSDAFPPSGCTGFASTGVGLNVDEKLSPDGRTIVQNLRFTSEDAQQHTVSAILNQTTIDARQWFFPGTSGFQDYTGTQSVSPVSPAVATIRNRVGSGTPDPDLTKGFGAITYAVTPASEQFWHVSYDAFVQRYTNLTIPAGRSMRVEFIYNVAGGSVALDGQAAAAEASIGAAPAIAVTSPTNVTAMAYTLTGTVVAPEVLNGFTVNDQPVSVAGDGSFSVPETLAAGANAFTLKASDELGRATSTPFSVTRGSAPPPSSAASVRFAKSGKPKLKGRSLATGWAATCVGAGPNCTVSVRATASRKSVAGRSLTVKAGATAKLSVTLGKAAAKLLTRKGKLKLTLVLTGKRSGARTTTARATFTLKRKR